MMAHRLSLETASGQVIMRDLGHPEAELVDVELPDGVGLGSDGTCAAGPPAEGTTSDGGPWIGVLDEYAAHLGPESEPMPSGRALPGAANAPANDAG